METIKKILFFYIQGVPKVRSYTLFVCNSALLDSVSKSFKQKLSFNLIHYSHTSCAIFWLEYSICVPLRFSVFSYHIFSVF